MAIVEGGSGYTGASGTFSHMLKRLQPQREIEKLWKQTYPLMNLIKKTDDFEGTVIDVPLEHDHPFVSRTYSNAATPYPSTGVKYSLTRKRLYGVGKVDMETARSARSDKGAWVRAIAREQQNVLLAMRKRTALQMYRSSGGALGRIVAAPANGDGTADRVTLINKGDAYNFSVGMACRFDSVDGGGTLHGGTAYVRKIDFTNGYLYFSDTAGGSAASLETITSTAIDANDYIFSAGDYDQSISGLADWIPLTAPGSSDSFFGINRSVAPERLAGHRINDTSLSREELVQELAALISYTNGMPEVATMAPIQLKAFAMELDTKVVRDPGGKGRVGFSGIVVDTAAGPVEVLADPACPEDRMYLIDPGSWTFHHLDAFPHLVQDEGLSMTRVSDADQVEFRYRCWGNLACTAPGKNGVAALPTVR